MGPGRVDTLVSCCKRHSSRRKPKGRGIFIDANYFGPGIVFFLLTGTLYGRWTEPRPRVASRTDRGKEPRPSLGIRSLFRPVLAQQVGGGKVGIVSDGGKMPARSLGV